jgi:hypothetical protein
VNPAIQKVIDTATAEVGYHEGRSGGHWNNQEKYAGQVPGLEWANGQPWCAVFVSWVALNAGVADLFPRTASCDVAAKWFRDRGQWSEFPSIGAQVFYGTAADLVHTGVVVDFDRDTITTVEGNTNDSGSREGDGVYRKVRQRRDGYVVGYGLPAYPVVPPKPKNFLDVVASANIKDTLPDGAASQAVARVIGQLPSAGHKPELLGLQEWDGAAPACIKGTVYRFVRAEGGGGPVIYDTTRYGLQHTKTSRLAPAQFVGVLPGRKSHLGESKAACYFFSDELGHDDVVLINVHLTAEIQTGKGYRTDAKHRLRVARHKLERAHLGVLVRWHIQRGRRVYVTGDTNFDSMPLAPLVPCWSGHADIEAQGTLGARTVDYVYAPDGATAVRRVPTASDHDAVVATYIRKV